MGCLCLAKFAAAVGKIANKKHLIDFLSLFLTNGRGGLGIRRHLWLYLAPVCAGASLGTVGTMVTELEGSPPPRDLGSPFSTGQTGRTGRAGFASCDAKPEPGKNLPWGLQVEGAEVPQSPWHVDGSQEKPGRGTQGLSRRRKSG